MYLVHLKFSGQEAGIVLCHALSLQAKLKVWRNGEEMSVLVPVRAMAPLVPISVPWHFLETFWRISGARHAAALVPLWRHALRPSQRAGWPKVIGSRSFWGRCRSYLQEWGVGAKRMRMGPVWGAPTDF